MVPAKYVYHSRQSVNREQFRVPFVNSMVSERDNIVIRSRPVNQKRIMHNTGESIPWIEHTVRYMD